MTVIKGAKIQHHQQDVTLFGCARAANRLANAGAPYRANTRESIRSANWCGSGDTNRALQPVGQ
jgi:hypothetical protein